MTAIAVPQEAQAIMDKIEERYDTGMPSRMAVARQLLDQRRQLEPFKVPEASRLAIDAIKNGRQVLIFADRVNTSTVRGETTPEQDRVGIKGKVIAESGGTIALLRKQLESQGIKPEDIVEMHGSSDVSQAEALRRFQSGEVKVMIGTSKVMGTGINADDTVGDRPRTTIMMTPEFSASDFMQVLGRTWRKNTNSIPDFHVLFSEIGVDQWGKALLSEKLATLGAAVGGSPKSLKFQERNLRGFGFHFQYV
jgi:ERCC4-related helicase